MIRVILLGSGNVAVHLAKAIGAAQGISLVQRYARGDSNSDLFDPGIPVTKDLAGLDQADLYIIAIKDDHITELSEDMSACQGLVVHTSGSIGMKELAHGKRIGVLYPVQTISASSEVDFHEIPLAIEAALEEDMELLREFANRISDKVFQLSSEQRRMLHLAAVFANNFSNHMFAKAKRICDGHAIPFDLLAPLMEETVRKAISIGPWDAQTGPARRKDEKVMKRQEELLEDDLKILYRTLSDSITKQYNQ